MPRAVHRDVRSTLLAWVAPRLLGYDHLLASTAQGGLSQPLRCTTQANIAFLLHKRTSAAQISHPRRAPTGNILSHILTAASDFQRTVGTLPPPDGTFKEVPALLGRHDKTAWNALVKQLNPSRVGHDFAEETATRIHHNLGSLPARLPAQLRYHACLLTHNALPTRGRTRSFSRGGQAEWRSSSLACVLCGDGIEDLAHLHTQCPVTSAAVAMIAQHSPSTRDFVTNADSDCFIFRSDLPSGALLHLLCLSRAIWTARKARACAHRAPGDSKSWRREGATAITECFLQLLKDSTKTRLHRRDRAAERIHFLQTLESVDDDAVIYYTDGSSFGNPGPAGAGYACYCAGTLVGSASVSLGETSNNVAELHGLHEALTDALNRSDSRGRCPPKKLYLFIDNQYALNVSTSKWKAKAHRPLITSIHKLMSTLQLSSDLSIGWVPGHAGVDGNEEADGLAKQGAQASTPVRTPTVTPPTRRNSGRSRNLPLTRGSGEAPASPPPSTRQGLRPRPQPRALAPGIDFSLLHAPRPRARPPDQCEHGVPYRLDRLTTGPPCLLCINLPPRDASLSPIRLPVDEMGQIIDCDPPYIPPIDFSFE